MSDPRDRETNAAFAGERARPRAYDGRMTIQRVMLVMVLGACGTTSGDRPTDDAGGTDGAGGGDAGDGGGGGGGGDLGTEIAKSGTRIKMKVLTTPDGAKQFSGFVDTARNNEDCSFQLASDGMTRCLPGAAPVADYFADAACTIRLTIAYTCSPPTYVAVPTVAASPTCPTGPTATGPRIYARGTAYPSYYSKSGTTCSGPNVVPNISFYGVTGAEIAPTSFQVATSAIE
ncbi:MAG: hypothetical protein JWP01_3370 [Myxococcales bacterium]|nr:hypothetical protein [Myxococcales bacterium]